AEGLSSWAPAILALGSRRAHERFAEVCESPPARPARELRPAVPATFAIRQAGGTRRPARRMTSHASVTPASRTAARALPARTPRSARLPAPGVEPKPPALVTAPDGDARPAPSSG